MLMVPVLLIWMFMLQLAALPGEQGSLSGFPSGFLPVPSVDRGSSTSFLESSDFTLDILMVPFPFTSSTRS